MIYTLTFNPALDYVINVKRFSEGEINRSSFEYILPGGKGINVSIVLSELSVENTALGFIGGFSGRKLVQLLSERKINTDFVNVLGGDSRINVKIKSDKETDLNASGPQISNDEVSLLFEKLSSLNENDFLILSGSIPSSLPDSIYHDIAQLLYNNNVPFVADAEKTLLEQILQFKPFLIKPNHLELGAFFGKNLSSKEEIAFCAKKLQNIGAKNVFVSMAGEGGILVCENNEIYFSPSPSGTVVNSTGAGDSLVAGFMAEYLSSKDFKRAFLMGLCAGSATAFSKDLATNDEIQKLFSLLNTNEIQILKL